MKIGIGISTYKRPEVFEHTLEMVKKFRPPNSVLVSVSDYDPHPPTGVNYVMEERSGVARVKNMCLDFLRACDHIFLFDDDCYPISDRWWERYIDSPEPHLMYVYLRENGKRNNIKEKYRDNVLVAYSLTKGCMLYFDRKVLDVVGGFDTAYGLAVGEHTDLTSRIYNAGLTSHRVMDVPNSHLLIHSMDEHGEVESSIDPELRKKMIPRNRQLRVNNRLSKAYKEFRS